MRTIDGMVAYEVRRSVWAEVLSEDVYVVGRKIERAIFDELIEELVACAGDLTDIFVFEMTELDTNIKVILHIIFHNNDIYG